VRSAPAPIERRRNRVERLLDRFVASA